MRLDKQKLRIAMARACMDTEDVIQAAEMPRPTFNGAMQGRSIRPATLGRIARALGVDVTEIIKED